MTLDYQFPPLSEVEDLRRSSDEQSSGISVVQMIQALRGCVQELNKSACSENALKAQHAIVVLDELRSALDDYGGADDVYERWPLIRTETETEAEIEHERDLREWREQRAREQQS